MNFNFRFHPLKSIGATKVAEFGTTKHRPCAANRALIFQPVYTEQLLYHALCFSAAAPFIIAFLRLSLPIILTFYIHKMKSPSLSSSTPAAPWPCLVFSGIAVRFPAGRPSRYLDKGFAVSSPRHCFRRLCLLFAAIAKLPSSAQATALHSHGDLCYLQSLSRLFYLCTLHR